MEMVFTLSDFGPPVDGEWRLDFTTLNNYELHIIKEVAGVVGGEMNEAFTRGDQEVTLALVAIALLRGGVAPLPDLIRKPDGLIWQAKPGQMILTVETDDAIAEKAGSPKAPPTENEPSSDASDERLSSIDASENASEQTLVNIRPSSTGPPLSDTGAESSLERSAV